MDLLMAIYDYVPVILFCLGGLYLIKDLYNKMHKGIFALLSMGIFTIGSAGIFKATWKLLYNTGICDFEALNKCFFPMQTLGFFYMALAMITFARSDFRRELRERTSVNCSVWMTLSLIVLSSVPKYTSSIIFVIVMSISVTLMYAILVKISLIHKKPISAVLYIVSLVFVLGMGYLSTKNFELAYMNWLAQTVNTVGQGTFFIATFINHKTGIGKYDAFIKNEVA